MTGYLLIYLFAVLGIEPGDLCMLHKCSTTWALLSAYNMLFNNIQEP
jgi:uncharacterized membrane protein